MFGRILDVYFANDETQMKVVDSNQGNKSLVCEADISCMPNEERTTLELRIYNLDKHVRDEIEANDYRGVTVNFGYKDVDGGTPNAMFKGTLRRMITQRPSAETSVTIFYAYELGDAYDYGFFSGSFARGTSLYDVCMTIASSGEVPIPIDVTTTFKNYYLEQDISLYDSQIELLRKFASQVSGTLFMQAMGRVYITTVEENANTEVIVFTGADENGELVSTSGLIGLPSMTDDGLSFECLPNPRLRIYSTVLIANTLISNAQEGFEAQSIAGAEYDKNGLYVVTKIQTHLANDAQQCKMSVTALARQYYMEGEDETV